MTGKNTTTPATPEETLAARVPVRLRTPAIIGNVSFAAGATLAVSAETAAWLVESGTAVIIPDPDKTESAPSPRKKAPLPVGEGLG